MNEVDQIDDLYDQIDSFVVQPKSRLQLIAEWVKNTGQTSFKFQQAMLEAFMRLGDTTFLMAKTFL
jgi:hypothetical protein